ncbi:nitroreductase family protein [Macrococcus caseolyticus]|uniref:nitroreductase family protein n=1 Tax=Macrococcoides caseolyticum TaxID=69966 RepID=UPI002DBEC9D2|nr:nitroreductase family protein [Macrococcus caseolyticus]MEB8171371.1 nitroreductase family protein [Macrococcus caseolyticus]
MNKEQLKAQILEAHNFRFATKVFDKDKPVDESDMKFILEVGRLSPSSIGLEPWRFVILENEAVNDILAKHGVMNPEEEGISVMVAFGYRAQGPKRPKARRPYDDVVSRF